MKIITLIGHDEYSNVMSILKNGASGYIIKSETVSEVTEAINTVMCRGYTIDKLCKSLVHIMNNYP